MLLCNYFNYIDKQQGRQGNGTERDINSYIIYGEAVPDGDAWFVARRCRNTRDCEIWNPMTGECYSFDRVKYTVKSLAGESVESKNDIREADPQCPLKKIWCFVGERNIYANIQDVEIPELLDFDLENKKLWKPFKEKDDDEYVVTYAESM